MSQIGINDLEVFVDATPAVAADVNSNFTVCKDAINETDTRTTAIEAAYVTKLSAPQTKTADYTIKDYEEIWVDSTSGARIITLPHTAVHVRIVWIAGTNDVTILPQSGTFNGAASYVMKTLNDSVDCKSSAADTYRWF